MEPEVQGETHAAMSRRRILGASALAGATVLLAASGGVSGAAPATPAAAPTGGAASSWLYLAILTGKMIGKSGWPTLAPADFTVPANATVNVELRCFDDGAAAVASGYEKVRGTADGSMTLVAGVMGDLSTAATQTVQAVDPKNVAHTLTIADIGLNIPIPPLTTVRFVLQPIAAGKHSWQCMAACGTGQGGFGGPMATNGYMTGTMAVL